MSDSVSDSELAQIISEDVTTNYIICALTALVVYEYFITLDQEVATVWRRKFTATSLLLVTTRWVMLLDQIFTWLPGAPQRCSRSCEALTLVGTVMLGLAVLQVALFSALRVFAIWGRGYLLATIVFLLSFVPLGADMYTWIHSSYYFVGDSYFIACYQTLNYSEDLDIDLTYLSRSSLIAADTIVLVCTWLKTFDQYRNARRLRLSFSVTACLFRDGTLYFAFLLILNIVQIVTFNSTSAPLGPFISTIPSILVARFIMNLRQAAGTPNNAVSISDIAESSVTFAPAFVAPPSYIGNIGEDLDHDVSLVFASGDEYLDRNFGLTTVEAAEELGVEDVVPENVNVQPLQDDIGKMIVSVY